MKRTTAPGDGGSVEYRLARLLDTPVFARVVPHLPAETLHQLIQYRGLDACGELVTSATPAQLASVLDIDLWRRAQPGRDEQFNLDRFGEWLEVLVETGESLAAHIVAAMDKDLVIAGLAGYLRPFDPGTFEPTESSDDEATDRHAMMSSETGSDVLECEVGGYLVRARRTDAWDAIVTLLITLDIEHNDFFHAVMRGCRRLANSRPEIDGLDDLLNAPDQQLHDVTIERERRRSRHGYATAADARAFLQMARHPQPQAPAASASTSRSASLAYALRTDPVPANPIATAYFRAAEEEPDTTPEKPSASAPANAPDYEAAAVGSGGDDDVATSIEAVVDLLAEAGVMPQRPRALLEAAEQDPRVTKLPLLKPMMEFVLHHDESAYLARTRELAFLANTLLAGSSVQSRPFTPQEASDAASCICNLGVECWRRMRPPAAASHGASSRLDAESASAAETFLVDHDLVTMFEVGWSVLYRDVSLFVADQLASILADLHCADGDTRRSLRTLRRTLVEQRRAGTPWLARDAADVLAMLDTAAWIAVLGLLDECPILPAALTAIVERRRTSISPTAFEFISTTEEIGDIRRFIKAIPALLAG